MKTADVPVPAAAAATTKMMMRMRESSMIVVVGERETAKSAVILTAMIEPSGALL